jgi:hypothetical protein
MQRVFRVPLETTATFSSLGATADERRRGPVQLNKWSAEDYAELVADKLRLYEREFKELNMLLFPEVSLATTCTDHSSSLSIGIPLNLKQRRSFDNLS